MTDYERAMAEAAKWHEANSTYDAVITHVLMVVFIVLFVWLVISQLTVSDKDDDFHGPKGA